MYDALIIGAGLMGAFCARALSEYDLKIALLDMNTDVCMGISRANTGVIYSGCDNKPGTLKAGLCAAGNSGMESLAEELDVPFSRCGSLMTASGPKGEAVLAEKLEQGIKNGISGLGLIDGDEARRMVPGLLENVIRALWVPSTGTINPWELGIAAVENAVQNGVELFLAHEAEKIVKKEGGYTVCTPGREFETRTVINCAGIAAAKISAMAGEPYFEIDRSRAEYLVLDSSMKETPGHIIFQEPENGDGVTVVPTAEGSILIGATNGAVRDEESGRATTWEGTDWLKRRTLEILPELPLDRIIRSFAGLRPRARWIKKDTSMDSFYISFRPGCDDFIDLIGMKTPGLTCASEVGRHAAGMIINKLSEYAVGGKIRKKTDFNRYVEKRIRFAGLSEAQKLEICGRDAGYGRIICRCRGVTEAEVLKAIAMRVGARTVDGVKRRTGAGLGRCQGGFCTERIMELLSRELGVPFERIEKDGPGSYIVRDPLSSQIPEVGQNNEK